MIAQNIFRQNFKIFEFSILNKKKELNEDL